MHDGTPILVATFVLALWIIFVALGYSIGQKKGHGQLGLVLALFFGLIGVIVVAAMSPAPSAHPGYASADRRYDGR